MSLTTTTINATVLLPDDAAPAQATLVFALKLAGFEQGAGAVPPSVVSVDLDANGQGSVALWANSLGNPFNYYTVSVTYYVGSPLAVEFTKTDVLGRINVPPSGGPYALETLLAEYGVFKLDWGSITEEPNISFNFGDL